MSIRVRHCSRSTGFHLDEVSLSAPVEYVDAGRTRAIGLAEALQRYSQIRSTDKRKLRLTGVGKISRSDPVI